MAISFTRPDPSSPSAVASAAFTTSRKGFEQAEVREFLRMVAAELARLQEREKFLERELRTMQRGSPNPSVALDEEVVTRMLGEEAARILHAAREGNSGWIDTAGLAPVHFQNFAEARTRFELLSTMGVAWAGCVEARPAPHDVQDTIPMASDPSSLFVPMFAPDEPDSGNSDGDSYPNSYLDDFGGSCPTPPQVCVRWSNRQNSCRQWGPEPLAPAPAQARTCKYDNATPSGAGPNSNCTTPALLPLTSHKSDVTAAIDLMRANGNTNIGEGVMWGRRVLSPELPFTEGRSWDDQNNRKFMVVMTDGQNTYQTYGNHNRSSYGAFGYAAKDRLGTSYSQSALVTQMNAKTSTACNAAKTQGITVYTIAFRLESDPTTLSLLQGCASGSDKAYRASDGQALIQVFQAVGREIAQLRVSS